jgi:hypothetical protein
MSVKIGPTTGPTLSEPIQRGPEKIVQVESNDGPQAGRALNDARAKLKPVGKQFTQAPENEVPAKKVSEKGVSEKDVPGKKVSEDEAGVFEESTAPKSAKDTFDRRFGSAHVKLNRSEFKVSFTADNPPAMEPLVDVRVPKKANVGSGGVDVACVPWEGRESEGFTLLLDITHKGDQFKAGEWVNLGISIPTTQGFKPLPTSLIKWPNVDCPHGVKEGMKTLLSPPFQPQHGRTQIAINIPYAEVQKKYPWFTSKFNLSVEPFFSRAGDLNFHTTTPVFAPIEEVQGERREFNIVPINKSTVLGKNVSQIYDQFLVANKPTELTTSIETEAEFTLGNINDEKQLEGLVLKVLDLKDKPEELQKVLGQGWELKGPSSSKDVRDAKGDLTQEAKKHPGFEKYGIAPERPDLKNRSVGRPGIIQDVYLHVGPTGIVRERRNFLGDGVLSVKGTNRRTKDETVMGRYCRQLQCPKAPVQVKDGVITLRDPGRLRDMLFSSHFDFGDALRGKGGGLVKGTPDLKPSYVVESERYRFSFVYKNLTPNVTVELSFDISRGWNLSREGKKQGEPKVFCGFEFGLDHLGGVGGGATTSQTDSIVNQVQTGPETSEDPKPVSDRVLDYKDLNHESVLDKAGKKNPTFQPFSHLVKNMTAYLCEDVPIRTGGHKAVSMTSTNPLPDAKLPNALFSEKT